MFRFACYAAVVFAIYWFGFRGGCIADLRAA